MKNLEINNSANIGKRTVGLEFENPVIKKDGNAIDFDTIQKVWKTFEKKGWTPRPDPALKNVIDGCSKQFGETIASVISDGGAGNFELALSPQENLHLAKSEYEKVYIEAKSIFKEHGLAIAGFAMQPGKIDDFDKFRRRNAMYLAWYEMKVSDVYAGSTSSAISAHQVGVGIRLSEFVEVTNELMKITGLIVALCGNSSINNWRILPWKEWRIVCMSHVRFVSDIEGFEKLIGYSKRPFTSIADFFGYYWDSPMMALPMLRNNEWVVPEEKINFLEFFTKNKKILGHNLKGEKIELKPEKEDINWAFVQMWPHVKPHISLDMEKVKLEEFVTNFQNNTLETYLEDKLTNCYIECRAGGAPPVGEEMALPALMLGIVSNIQELKEITKLYSWDEWGNLVYEAAKNGIESTIGRKSIVPLLEKFYRISEKGLKDRNLAEEKYLEPIEKRLATSKNPADVALEYFKKGKKDFIEYISYK